MQEDAIDFRQLGEESSDLIIAFDAQFRYTYVNPQVEALVGMSRHEMLGRTIWEVAPHTEGTIYGENYRRAVRERALIEFEDYYPPLDRWNHVRCVPSQDGDVIVFARNVTEEHRSAAAREQALANLRESEAEARRIAGVLDIVRDAHITLDSDFRITYANAEAARLNRRPVLDILGRKHGDLWPRSIGSELERRYCQVMAHRQPDHFEHHLLEPGKYDIWMSVSAYPDEVGGGLHVVLRDITVRVRREQRELFLSQISDALGRLTDPSDVAVEAVKRTGEFLTVCRCIYSRIDHDSESRVAQHEYRAPDDPVRAKTADFPQTSAEWRILLAAGNAVIANDAIGEEESLSEIKCYAALGIRSFVIVPLIHSGRLVATMAALSGTRRDWAPEEVELLRTVLQRTWLTEEVTQQNRSIRENLRERILAEARLERTLALLKAVVDGAAESGDMISAIDREHRFLLANGATVRFLGAESEAQLIGQTDAAWMATEPPLQELRQRIWDIDEQVMQTGTALSFEMDADATPHEGGRRTYIAAKAPLRDRESGAVTGLVNLIHDITERKRAERRLLRLYDSGVVGVIFWNLDTGLITDANEVFLEMVGYTREDLAAGRLNFRKMTPQEWTDRNEQGVDELRRQGYAPAYEKEYIRKDGSRVPILIGGTRFEDSPCEGYSYILDISERKAEDNRRKFLGELSERTRSMLDPDAVVEETLRSVGAYLRLDRFVYAEVQPEMETAAVRMGYFADGTLEGPGRSQKLTVLSGFAEVLAEGRTAVCVDTATDPRTTDQYAAFWLEARVRSIVLVPLLREGKWTALFSAIASQSRQWLPEEVRLLEAVAERMWPSMENARMHVEARIRAEREALLSECSRLFNASLDYAETLASVAQMIVPRFSDWCAVDLLGSDGQPARVAVAHVNPEKVAWAWELHRQNPTRREAERGVAAVLRSGKSEFMPRIPDQMLVAAARDSDQLRLLREIGLRSVLIVPLAVRGNVLGALTLVATDESGRFFSDEDLRFAEEIGRRAALAIENARLFQATQEAEAKQRRIADTLQESMLLALPAPDAFQGLEISPYYEAAWDEALIGGDYGDAFQLDNNRVALVVGDCTGKGLAAARFLAECQFMLRAFLRETGEPDDSLLRLNRMLIESQRLDRRPESALTTVAVAVIDLQTGETVLSVGGAEPPLLIAAATGKGTAIEVRGPLVGMDASARYERAILTLHPGDILLLTSDGTTEARSRTTRQFFGYDGLTRAAEELALGRPELTGLAKDIVDRAREFAGGALTDDACVVVARYIGR